MELSPNLKKADILEALDTIVEQHQFVSMNNSFLEARIMYRLQKSFKICWLLAHKCLSLLVSFYDKREVLQMNP